MNKLFSIHYIHMAQTLQGNHHLPPYDTLEIFPWKLFWNGYIVYDSQVKIPK
jgi:hypothetical protein